MAVEVNALIWSQLSDSARKSGVYTYKDTSTAPIKITQKVVEEKKKKYSSAFKKQQEYDKANNVTSVPDVIDLTSEFDMAGVLDLVSAELGIENSGGSSKGLLIGGVVLLAVALFS